MSKRHVLRRDALRLALGVVVAAEAERVPSTATVRRAEAVLTREGIERAPEGWAATVKRMNGSHTAREG